MAPMPQPSDAEILARLTAEPESAWKLFLERHAETILALLARLGFTGDEAMDRFVYVCEKLTEDQFRRLRSVRFLGREGELIPWLAQVVRRLAINWAQSEEGRRRLFRPLERLPRRAQQAFELHFWHGLSAAEIWQRLRAEGETALTLLEVYEDLSTAFSALDATRRWRLLAQLHRRREPLAISPTGAIGAIGAIGGSTEGASEATPSFHPADPGPSPEADALRREEEALLGNVLGGLAARERLILRLHFDEGLALAEVAEVTGLSKRQAGRILRQLLDRLRAALAEKGYRPRDLSVGGEGRRRG